MTTIDLQRQLSVQDQVRQDQEVGFGLLFHLVRAGELISPWWSQRRDKELRAFAKNSDHFSGAEWMIGTKLASVPYLVEARDSSVKAHVKMANQYQAILTDMVQFGQGWEVFWTKFFKDVWECDNGAFGEIIGEGDPDGPIKGPSLGLAHLDSTRCSRTSNPEFPVVYQDTNGRRYRFHHTRIVFRSQQPSTAAEMHNVGFCWLSRSINSIQRLIDVATYNQEKLGSRPLRQLILGKGIDGEKVQEAIQAAGELMDNRGLRRYAQAPILAHPAQKDWDIELRDLASLPDGFDEKTTTEFAMFVIALSGGFPPRWLWPATSVGSTKADAMYSHISGSGGGATWHLNMMRDLLSYSGRASDIGPLLPPKFLPKELRLVFDYQDDEQDRLKADVRSTRAKTRQLDLNAGVVTVRVSREQALAAGDITQAQFNHMELEDGRLPNGDDVLTLFSSKDEFFVQVLGRFEIGAPVSKAEVDSAILELRAIIATAPNAKQRDKSRQAMAALEWLQTDDAEPEEVKKPSGGGAKPKKTPEQIETERERKKVEAEQERQAETEQKCSESFDHASEEFGIEREDLDALQSFGDGETLDEEVAGRLAEVGLVEIAADGRPRLTSDARTALTAADKADARRMLDAISRAMEKIETKAKDSGLVEVLSKGEQVTLMSRARNLLHWRSKDESIEEAADAIRKAAKKIGDQEQTASLSKQAPPPQINVTVEPPPPAQVNVTVEPSQIDLHMPEQIPAQVDVTVEATQVDVNVEPPPPAQVDVNVEAPQLEVNLPEQPDVNVNLKAELHTDAVETETIVERDPTTGRISKTTKMTKPVEGD